MIQLHPRSTRTDTLVPYTSLVRSVVGGLRLLFSGDLGPEHKAFHPDPAAPSGSDHIVCESTYGDQTRKQYTIRQRRTLLQGEIREAIAAGRSEEHTSELQSLMRISYAVFCLKKKKQYTQEQQ